MINTNRMAPYQRDHRSRIEWPNLPPMNNERCPEWMIAALALSFGASALVAGVLAKLGVHVLVDLVAYVVRARS